MYVMYSYQRQFTDTQHTARTTHSATTDPINADLIIAADIRPPEVEACDDHDAEAHAQRKGAGRRRGVFRTNAISGRPPVATDAKLTRTQTEHTTRLPLPILYTRGNHALPQAGSSSDWGRDLSLQVKHRSASEARRTVYSARLNAVPRSPGSYPNTRMQSPSPIHN